MIEEPGYEREWTADLEPGRTRIRYGLTTDDGVPVRFLVQLEYRVSGRWDGVAWQPGEWRVVARFDHEASGPDYRNVEAVGLHMDVSTLRAASGRRRRTSLHGRPTRHYPPPNDTRSENTNGS